MLCQGKDDFRDFWEHPNTQKWKKYNHEKSLKIGIGPDKGEISYFNSTGQKYAPSPLNIQIPQ